VETEFAGPVLKRSACRSCTDEREGGKRGLAMLSLMQAEEKYSLAADEGK